MPESSAPLPPTIAAETTMPRGFQTHSGKIFPPHLDPITCPPSFDFAALLRESTAAESDELEDEILHNQAQGSAPKKDPISMPCNPHPKRPASPTAPGISRSHQRRRYARHKDKTESGQYPLPSTILTHVAPSTPIPTQLMTEELPVAAGGYAAKCGKVVAAKKSQLVAQLLEKDGFEYVPWDGYECTPLLDHQNRIFTVAVGQPRDGNYAESARRAHSLILEEGRSARFKPEECHHRRGHFPALNVGITYGKGTKSPVNLRHDRHSEMLKRLCASSDIKRLATFASASFATWAPRVYAYYKDHLDRLWHRLPHLNRNFPKSVFPCAAFNFGPETCTYKHRDVLNCPFGFCAIQALGDFDPKLGGHLILWEVKKLLEFPPGSLVLIPSATITHSNTPIQAGESRTSFTQFCAGGLLRYVDNGFRTEAELEAADPVAYEQMLRDKKDRWKMGLGLLSCLEDLIKPVAMLVERIPCGQGP